ncbi:MAG: hypothetical protein R3E01_28685 [Pirellulaceae bacterium]
MPRTGTAARQRLWLALLILLMPMARVSGELNRPTPLFTRQALFMIPFQVATVSSGHEPSSEIVLYVSGDRGQTWQEYQRQPPDTGRFSFRAGADGEFWFQVRTQNDASSPPVANQGAELIVIVDTEQPQLQFECVADSDGNLVARWLANDVYLDANSFALDYRFGDAANWQRAASAIETASPSPNGWAAQTSWRPEGEGSTVTVRAQISDRSGNSTVVQRQVLLTNTGPSDGQLSLAAIPSATSPATASGGPALGGPPSVVRTNPGFAGQAGSPRSTALGTLSGRPQPPKALSPNDESLPSYTPFSLAPNSQRQPPGFLQNRSNNAPPVAPLPAELPTPPPLTPHAESSFGTGPSVATPSPVADPNTPQMPAAAAPGLQPIPELTSLGTVPDPSTVGRPPIASPSPTPTGLDAKQAIATPEGLQREPLPANRKLCNSRRFRLDYDVDAAGASGVARVELWYTRDNGMSWRHYGDDPDKLSPFMVEVNEDGLYGFRLVIHPQEGLSMSAPESGEDPDMWIQVDATLPLARITSARYGTGINLGQLQLLWQASDYNLSQNPITISYSDAPNGPWTPIAEGVANTGHYTWQVDGRVPRQLYLRLQVRDDAGNIGEDRLRDPISSDGLAPRGRILDFRPADRRLQNSMESPLR